MTSANYLTSAYLRFAARRFWTWWLQRLSEVVPGSPAASDRRRNRQRRIAVIWSGTQWRFDGAPAPSEDAATKRLLVELPPGSALVRTASYPMDVANIVADLLAADIDRLTPFAADEVALTWRTIDYAWQTKQVEVEFAVIRRQALQDLFEQAHRAGLQVAGAVPHAAAEQLMFADPEVEARRSSGLRRANWWLVSTLVAMGVALALPAVQMHRERLAIEAELAAMRDRAESGATITERVTTIERSHQFVDALLNETISPLFVLSELSRLAPDDAWLVSLSIQGGVMTLRGNAGSAAEFVSAISASPYFGDIQYDAGSARFPGTDAERFELTATLVMEPRQ